MTRPFLKNYETCATGVYLVLPSGKIYGIVKKIAENGIEDYL